MDKYMEKIHSIISDARLSIKEEGVKALESTKDEEEQKRIKLASIHYEIMLSEMLLYNKEIEEKINDRVRFMSNKGVKVILDKDPTVKEDLSIENYAYEGEGGAFVSDEDPVLVETKSGKVIVLDEEPEFFVGKTGHKIVLDKDPKIKIRKTDHRIVLDEDPISIRTKTGKKIILDDDPVTKKLKSNKVIILSEDPIYKVRKTGTLLKLDDDPVKKRPKTNHRIDLDEDPVKKRPKTNHKIVLDEDPIKLSIADDDLSDNEVTIEIDK